MKYYLILIHILFIFQSFSQESIITGLILNQDNVPIEGVNITIDENIGTTSDKNGFYKLILTANKKHELIFTHISYEKIKIPIEVLDKEVFEFNPVLSEKFEQISEVIINSNSRLKINSVLNLSPEKLRNIKGIQPGIENILKTLPGVSINNEMSSQYSVRGGNFDENLIYVNGIEIYRPLLIRAGQQEGLSFINSEMTENVKFSSGGFEAKYGDKMSSVLDIKYRVPKNNDLKIKTNLLGASLVMDNVFSDSKITNLLGIRYRDNSLLVNSKETNSNFRPSFFDIQNFLNLNISPKLNIGSILNYSKNSYNFKPLNRQTNFGTLEEPIALVIFYQGEEKDNYASYFNSIFIDYELKPSTTLNLTSSFYNANEKEYYDILAQYNLAEVNTNIGSEELGEIEFSQGVGSQLNHARNDLNAQIFNIESKIKFIRNKNEFNFSLKYSDEKINDRIVEWEVIDSAGYFIDPPFILNLSEQPYEANEGPIVPFQNIRSTTKTKINRIQLYSQWENETYTKKSKIFYNIGLRYHAWRINNTDFKSVFSPRFQISIIPNQNPDMIYRFKYGIYHQPPFYKELRGYDGLLNLNVEAQKSIHYVVSNEYNFDMWNRPFKLTSEIYYKYLENVNPYTLENVRIRYSANNNANAYAYGLDFRINGEFVKDTESWFSFGYLKTEENINNRGYIPRPTDQRLKFGVLFQDYIPKIPNLKMFINLIYNTGLPGGSPSYADAYEYLNRLPDYKRADIGISYELSKSSKFINNLNLLKNFDKISIGLEIFNMFNMQNSITNTWVRDVYSKRQYSIPNYLTPRIFNLNLDFDF